MNLFSPTAPLLKFVAVVGFVSTGFIIGIVVVVTACLLIAAKKYKHKKNSPGEDYSGFATTALYSLLFSTAPIDYVYQKQTTTENRFVLSHMHV